MVSLREPQIIDLEGSNPIINWTIKAETSKKKEKKNQRLTKKLIKTDGLDVQFPLRLNPDIHHQGANKHALQSHKEDPRRGKKKFSKQKP